MKRLLVLRLLMIIVFVAAILVVPAPASAASPQTFTVLVGAENVSRGVGVMAYFPAVLHIHVGDTVMWKQNTHEIHTVTFLAGGDAPALLISTQGITPPLPSPLMINPQAAFPTAPADGMYDGSTFANSGIMSTDPGSPTQFSLTFTKEGSYDYECLVHGMMMSGTIVVDPASASIPSPAVVMRRAKSNIKLRLAGATSLFGQAMAQVPAPQHNSDGTTTYTVLIGWAKGQYELMDFFPKKLVVHPGDTVNFMLSSTDDAPHTVTFLNGGPDISFVLPYPPPPAQPQFLLFNPEVLGPINAGQPLTNTGVFSSGLLDPTIPGFPTSYSWVIGDVTGLLPYECLLHDTSGMQGVLQVVPR